MKTAIVVLRYHEEVINPDGEDWLSPANVEELVQSIEKFANDTAFGGMVRLKLLVDHTQEEAFQKR
jgi:hypothetical protein